MKKWEAIREFLVITFATVIVAAAVFFFLIPSHVSVCLLYTSTAGYQSFSPNVHSFRIPQAGTYHTCFHFHKKAVPPSAQPQYLQQLSVRPVSIRLVDINMVLIAAPVCKRGEKETAFRFSDVYKRQ